MGFFQDLFGQTGAQASRHAGQTQAAGLQQGYDLATPAYGQARTDVTQGFGAAGQTYQPLYDIGTAGAKFYADISGANGPAAQAAASSSFQTDPGYQFALTQGQQAAERLGSKYGQDNSGNLIDAEQKNAIGLASQQYASWVNRLAPFLNYSLGGAAGLAGTQAGAGTAQAAIDKALGDLGYQTKAGEAAALAGGELGAAKSQQAASQNIFNQGVSLAGKLLGAGIGSGATGGGGIGGALGSLFGGNTAALYGANPAADALTGGGGYYGTGGAVYAGPGYYSPWG